MFRSDATNIKGGKPKRRRSVSKKVNKRSASKSRSKGKKVKKGGNFLGVVGELFIPTGFEHAATTAGLVGLDAYSKKISERKKGKKGGAKKSKSRSRSKARKSKSPKKVKRKSKSPKKVKRKSKSPKKVKRKSKSPKKVKRKSKSPKKVKRLTKSPKKVKRKSKSPKKVKRLTKFGGAQLVQSFSPVQPVQPVQPVPPVPPVQQANMYPNEQDAKLTQTANHHGWKFTKTETENSETENSEEIFRIEDVAYGILCPSGVNVGTPNCWFVLERDDVPANHHPFLYGLSVNAEPSPGPYNLRDKLKKIVDENQLSSIIHKINMSALAENDPELSVLSNAEYYSSTIPPWELMVKINQIQQ